MSSQCVVNVSFGLRHFQEHQDRLVNTLQRQGEKYMTWWNRLPEGSPTHKDKPYAFKAHALRIAKNHDLVMWADSCIVPVKRLDRIWEYAREHGVWMSYGGWTNYEWTADSAYAELFKSETCDMEAVRLINRSIPHVAATAFAIDQRHEIGQQFLSEYIRLANTDAFCGPWKNSLHPDTQLSNWVPGRNDGKVAICGPADVRGHRHDQTCASVIAWRLGIPLTRPPAWFAYKGGETEETILVADGSTG